MADNNFWEKIEKPIFALAPMAGIADSAFRRICKEFGADVLYGEMASAAALVYNPIKTLELLQSDKKEAPYIAQLFGSNPDHFAKAVRLLASKKQQFRMPDGIDINFGCPVPKIFKQGAGAALMRNLKQAREVIKAVLGNTDLPVSIKLRAKSGEIDCLMFLDYMKDLPISAAMIHGRTLAQGFGGPVDREIIKKARNYFGGIILANGGVMSARDAFDLLEKTKAGGVGIARGALGRPWLFREMKNKKAEVKGEKEIFKIALKHAELAEKLKSRQGIIEMRKHLCWYVRGLPGASEMRSGLVKVESLEDVKNILK
ncbi:tRNA-dihydrouridine synthase [Patescibacteria group bacterium]|nr:tRNA-dihydrouridine synthase [Patescibacteria group bacterium]